MKWAVSRDAVTGESYMSVDSKGRSLLLNPFTNKGTAFPPEERTLLDLHGLLPPAVSTMEQQLERTYENFQAKETDLERFIYLASLHDRNETLFFRLIHEHIEEMMPIVYTPVVGEACQKFSHIYRRTRGLYISIDQMSSMEDILANAPLPVAIIVATDGERILGLGDLGAGGMGIPIGKLCLYTLCAGVPPYFTLPVMLDVGTDNEDRLEDPLYLGLRRKRVRGKAYQEFIDRFVSAVQRVHPHALLQWEDLLKANALHQLHRFQDRIRSFNDDIQGTAAVALAGLYGALRMSGGELRDQRIVFAGAGASAQGIGGLLVTALVKEGVSLKEARRRIWMVDSKGLVTWARSGLEDFKETFARDTEELASFQVPDRERISLEETVDHVAPTILIGASGTPGIVTEEVVEAMARVCEQPVVFPLSNPTSRAECTPGDALRWSRGRAIVATGSPFDPVEYGGRRFRIGQCNNAFIFPGVGLGAWVSGAARVTPAMFMEAARALADEVSDADLAEGAVFPRLTGIRDCSHKVACAVIRQAVRDGQAEEAVLDDLEASVSGAMWFPDYLPLRLERRVGWCTGAPRVPCTETPAVP